MTRKEFRERAEGIEHLFTEALTPDAEITEEETERIFNHFADLLADLTEINKDTYMISITDKGIVEGLDGNI